MCDNDEIIDKFLLNTCRLHPQVNKHALHAVHNCAFALTVHPADDGQVDFIPLITGSLAEFYIEPMLSCVGDVDVMYYYNTMLAIPAGQSPPTQLPDEFHNYVSVHEIVDSHLPGYVYLKSRYLLTESTEDGKYNVAECYREQYLSNTFSMNEDIHSHGPAFVFPVNQENPGDLPLDLVYCIRCLSWPTQAADWSTRHRNYDWPDSATVYRVVSNGCDVVAVAHHQCRDDEWMAAHQFRLSFSRAEVVLLNSWTPVQQIVYHLLRYFAKTEQLTVSVDCKPRHLSNYHIKTLMLWACELKPRCWWTENIRFVEMCVELLHNFTDWLSAKQCPHYFINNCNLIDSTFNVKAIASKLSSVDETWLSTWLVDNYIRKCSLLCPVNVSRLFSSAGTVVQLRNAVSAVVDWRVNSTMLSLWNNVRLAESFIRGRITEFSLSVPSFRYFFSEMTNFDRRLGVYFNGVTFLHFSCKISNQNAFDDDLMEFLAAVVGQCLPKKRLCSKWSSEVSLSKAGKLMKDVASKSNNTDPLIKIELSKAYLYRALRCTDSYSDSIYCLANVYLAVLNYITGEYRTATDHCTLVMESENQSCVVQGELLPETDDHIDSALGLSTLYQYVLWESLNKSERKKYVTVFTPVLFAHYLRISCHRVSLQSRHLSQSTFVGYIAQYQQCLRKKLELFITDAILYKLTYRLPEYNVHCKTAEVMCKHLATNATELNTSNLVELLQKSAVEHLTTYRQLISSDFSSVAAVVTTDFEALYEYKRGNYQRCLQLSTQNVDQLLNAELMANVPTYPEFIQLMDDDIVSLTALTLIVSHTGRICESLNNVTMTQLTLSLYLMTQCQSRLRQSVTSLSQTLDYIEVARRRHQADMTLDHLALKLTERIAVKNSIKFLGH